MNIDQLPGLYYVVSWKVYSKDKNTWKPLLVVSQLQKLFRIFYMEYSNKLTIAFLFIDTI